MILLATFLLGGVFGMALWIYVSGFIHRLQHNIHITYAEFFPQNPPPFQPCLAALQQKKCGHILWYFFIVGFGFVGIRLMLDQDLFALWWGSLLLLLWAISYLDWHYQLISPTACLCLMAFGVFGADQRFSSLTLAESLQSAAGFFVVFYGIYWIAKAYYRKEAFGRGDYWLALGLGSLLPLGDLPHFLLLACLLGIGFAFMHRNKKEFLPFAPFMCLSALAMLMNIV